MARAKGQRKPKYRTVIEKSESLQEVGQDLIKAHGMSLKSANIEYVMKTRLDVEKDTVAPPLEKDQLNPGTASACSAVDQTIHHSHFKLVVNGNWWEKADGAQKEALVYHLLCHLWFVEGKPRLVKHDFQGFVSEVREYGAWTPSLRHFQDAMKQTTLPLEAGEPAAAADGEGKQQLGLV